MKKNKILLFIIAIMLFLPLTVYAGGSITVNTRNITINKGKSGTFTIRANNAAGRVDISSSNTSIAKVNKSSQWVENNSTTVTVTGVSAGTTTVTVILTNAATFDEEKLTGTYTITINVKDPSSGGGGGNNNNNNNNNKSNLSNNNNIENLGVKGYQLTKKDNNNYELTVNNNVTNIEITGNAQDKKAKISGTGTKELKVGENKLEVIVTSESGRQNKFVIKVTRKEGFYLDDIETVLNDDTITPKSIITAIDGKISKDVVEKIKSSGKTVSLDGYNEEKKLLYSWILDGSKIKNATEFNTNVSFTSELVNEIGEASNYAEGKYIHFEHDGKLPEGTKIRLYVGDKFEDDTVVNVYFYNSEKKLDEIKKGLTVKDGYIEFEIDHCSDYFVTRATITYPGKTTNIYMYIAIVEFVLLIVMAALYLIKKDKSKKKK